MIDYGDQRSFPVFTVYLGQGDPASTRKQMKAENRCDVAGAPAAMVEMCEVARHTGGDVFGASPEELAGIFKEIGGYQ